MPIQKFPKSLQLSLKKKKFSQRKWNLRKTFNHELFYFNTKLKNYKNYLLII